MNLATENTILFKTKHLDDFKKYVLEKNETRHCQCVYSDQNYTVYTFDAKGYMNGLNAFPYVAYEYLMIDSIEDGLYTRVLENDCIIETNRTIEDIIREKVGEEIYQKIKPALAYPTLESYNQLMSDNGSR